MERNTELEALTWGKMSAGLPVWCKEKESLATVEEDEGRNVLNTSRSPPFPPLPLLPYCFPPSLFTHQTPVHLSSAEGGGRRGRQRCRLTLASVSWLIRLIFGARSCAQHLQFNPESEHLRSLIPSAYLWHEVLSKFSHPKEAECT